jgi:hypothetical protein
MADSRGDSAQPPEPDTRQFTPEGVATDWHELVHSEQFSEAPRTKGEVRRGWNWRYAWLLLSHASPLLLVALALALSMAVFTVVGLFVRPFPGWPATVFDGSTKTQLPTTQNPTDSHSPSLKSRPSASSTTGAVPSGATPTLSPTQVKGPTSLPLPNQTLTSQTLPSQTPALPLPSVSISVSLSVPLPPISVPALPPLTSILPLPTLPNLPIGLP